MVKILMEEAGAGFLHEPEEWLPASLDRIEDGDDYGYGDTIKLILHVDGDETEGGEQRETWAMASAKLSPRSKLYGWVNGIDPTLIPEIGGVLDVTGLAGRRVDVMFSHTSEGGQVKERVEKLRTSKTEAPTKPAPTKTDLEKPF